MVRLVCVLTLSPTSPFWVELEENRTLDELKKEIKRLNEDLIKCDADKLRLYLAKRNGEWLNNWGAFHLKPHALGMDHLKHPQMSLKYAELGESSAIQLSEEELIERNGLIHVVVVVPVSAESPDMRNICQAMIDEVIDASDEKRGVFSFADCPSVKIEELKQSLGLSTKLLDVEEDDDSSVPGFQWDENCNDDKIRMSYLNTHLQDVLYSEGKQCFYLEDSKSDENLLSINDTRMEFAVKGTADLVLVDEVANQNREATAGLCFVVEVKKDLLVNVEDYLRQTLLKLIVADFMCSRSAPMGLLTDLNDAWYFVWFTGEKEIVTLLLECPAKGFQFIKGILASNLDPSEDIYLAKSRFVTNPDDLKRRKLNDLIPRVASAAMESFERFNSISEYLSPEFMKEQQLKCYLDALSQMPACSFMTFEQQSKGT